MMHSNTKVRRVYFARQVVVAMAVAGALTTAKAYASGVVYDNWSAVNNNNGATDDGADVSVSTGIPDTFIGAGLVLTPGTTEITGFDLFPTNATNELATPTNLTFTNIKLNIYLWGAVNAGTTSATNPAFGDLLTTTPISLQINGTLSPGYYFNLENGASPHILPGIALNTPLSIPSNTVGLTVEVQGSTNNGSSFADYNGLTSYLAVGTVAPAVGSDYQEGWHRNANGETNGNFTSTLRVSGDTYTSIGTDVYGGSPVNYSWSSPVSGTFTDTTKWTPAGVPGPGDSAAFNLASPSGYTVEMPGNQEFTNCNVQNDNVTFDLDAQASQMYISGGLTVGVPATSGTSIHGSLTIANSEGQFFNLAEANAIIIGGSGGIGKITTTTQTYLYSDNDTAINAGSSLVVGVYSKFGTNTLTIAGTTNAWTGLLDIGQSALDIRSGNIATVMNQLSQGFNNGKWNGSGGIISSAAAADSTHLTAVGAILNTDNSGNRIYGSGTTLGLFDSGNGTLAEDDPGLGAVLLKYTYYGDANLDGTVDGSDYTLIDNGFINHLTGWYNGDFNYDGVVNGSDYTLIDNAFNTQGSGLGISNFSQRGGLGFSDETLQDGVNATLTSTPVAESLDSSPSAGTTNQFGATSVPEPTSLLSICLLGGALLKRRSRRR